MLHPTLSVYRKSGPFVNRFFGRNLPAATCWTKPLRGSLIETRQFAQSTFRLHLSALKFLYRRTLGCSWPVLALPRIGAEKKLPVVLSRAEVRCLLDQVRQPAARLSLTLMYTCGLRVSEALHLRVEDIDSQRRVVWVRHGKGTKDRSVPLPQQTLAQLRAYWRQYRPATALFPANSGPGDPLPWAHSPCPYCQTGTLVYVRRLPPQGRPPP